MNITYIIGLVAAILVFLLGIVMPINVPPEEGQAIDRKSTRLNSSHWS